MKKPKKSRNKKFTTLSIPVLLFKKVKEQIEGTGFISVSSYVTYILREIEAEKKVEGKPFTQEDKERVKAKLRALGYID